MPTDTDCAVLPPTVADCLVRTQQMLLRAKCQYVAGDPNTWPAGVVLMKKQEWVLAVAPLPEDVGGALADWKALRQAAGGPCGLLLVGSPDADGPLVRGLLDAAGGQTAYLDPVRGKFTRGRHGLSLSGTIPPLRARRLRQFLDPGALGAAGRVDCRARLASDIEEARSTAEFFQASRRAGGVMRPRLTYGMVALFAVTFLAMYLRYRGHLEDAAYLAWGALSGPLVRRGEVWRLLSCMLVHANLIHLAFNCTAMLFIGRMLEVLQGRWRLELLFVFSVVTGSLASLYWHPHVVSVGASGGIFGLIGVVAAMVVRHRKAFPAHLWRGLRKWLFQVLAYNVVLFLLPFIDNAAHVGGLLGGFALGLLLTRPPRQAVRPGRWAWAGTAALCAAVAAAGYWVILRIPK